MEIKTMIIADLAAQVSAQFEQKERPNGDKFWARKNDAEDWIQELCRKAHGDMLPDDWRYRFIVNALDVLSDFPADNIDRAYDALGELMADIYTSELTEWLNSRCDRVHYLTEALEEHQCDNGFDALTMAQLLERQEVANSVLESLQARLEELESE